MRNGTDFHADRQDEVRKPQERGGSDLTKPPSINWHLQQAGTETAQATDRHTCLCTQTHRHTDTQTHTHTLSNLSIYYHLLISDKSAILNRHLCIHKVWFIMMIINTATVPTAHSCSWHICSILTRRQKISSKRLKRQTPPPAC